MRCFPLLALVLAVALHGADTPTMRIENLAPPASGNAIGPNVTMAPDGTAWLTWIERNDRDATLRFATLRQEDAKWSEPATIAGGASLYAGTADFPAVTVGRDGKATALWYVQNPPSADTAHLHHGAGYHAVVSQTTDGGKTWSAPAALARESSLVEFAALTTLASGRVLAVWLDGRKKKAAPGQGADGHKGAQQLFSRVLGTDGPDVLVDPLVCDCCPTSLTAFPDGTALVAYRGRTAGEIRDIKVSRFRRDAWDAPRTLVADEWKINGCPVNGPQIVSDGGRVAAAWFTAANDEPRVQASISSDAGGRFMMPIRISQTSPAGRVSTALLHDGAMLVTWVEAEGGLNLRRVSPDFVATEPLALRKPGDGTIKGFPRVALRRDYAGGNAVAQLVVAYTTETPSALHTTLVSVPEAELLVAEKTCDCDASAEQLQGFPIRGTLTGVRAETATVSAEHFEVPGIFAAGTREFKVTPDTLAKAKPDQPFFGRIARRDAEWWLVEVRLIAAPPPR